MSDQTVDPTTGERDVLAARIARAEALIDAWEHDAPGLVVPVFIGRLREVLRRDPAPVHLRHSAPDQNSLPTCCSGEDSSECCPGPRPAAAVRVAPKPCTCSPYFGCSEYEPDCPVHGIEARKVGK